MTILRPHAMDVAFVNSLTKSQSALTVRRSALAREPWQSMPSSGEW